MKRNFILGEEWLYYKIYCGKRTADTILIGVIKPLSEQLLKKDLIDRWFYIRYSDPKPHLRLRFHCKSTNTIGTIIEIVKDSVTEQVKNGTIWSIQTDMYSRELERYGFNLINETEYFFYINNIVCLEALHLIEDDVLLFLFSLRSIDTILNVFDFDIDRKIRFTKYYFDAFKQEFNTDKTLSKQLNVKYQALRQSIVSFLTQPQKEYSALINLLSDKKQRLKQVSNDVIDGLKQEQVSLEDLLASHIHMNVNRLFRDKQRLHELVCYSCLYRFYQFQKSVNA